MDIMLSCNSNFIFPAGGCRLVRLHNHNAHDAPPVRLSGRFGLLRVSLPALGVPCGCAPSGGEIDPVAVAAGVVCMCIYCTLLVYLYLTILSSSKE